jgi:hypothetical protein
MPVVTKKMSRNFGVDRPTCSKCGKFVGEGGFCVVFFDIFESQHKEGRAFCKKCFKNIRETKKKIELA